MLSQEQIVRAWKEPEYRNSLSDEERAQLPAHPAGAGEVSDADLEAAAGGTITDLNPGGDSAFKDGFTDIPGVTPPKSSTKDLQA
jgi:mersacidin/lichenicidin family type 2 lantibiotic